MKAILQNFKSGELKVDEVPPPVVRPGGLLVRNVASLVSAGTERAVMALAKMNLLQKARTRPDLVRKVLARAGQEGWLATAQMVLNLVSTPLPLGYSCAGVVEKVGTGVGDWAPGERVACAGLGYANHAEVVFVPRNLAVRIPQSVEDGDAAFVTLGAIALHAVRQAEVRIGENVVILGLGLVGQLAAQICVAAGCQVFGVDLDDARVALARDLGMQGGQSPHAGDLANAIGRFTRHRGADAVLIAAATKSSQLVVDAAAFARDRGRVVAVGDVGLDVPRHAYYEKELELRLSRSYGPGRYDPSYEEHGRDYPLGYVRWTENRNMEAFLDLVAEGRVRIKPLITHRYPIARAQEAYALLSGERERGALGILLEYDPRQPQPATIELAHAANEAARSSNDLRLGVIGAGQFAQGILLPIVHRLRGVQIQGIANASGLSARAVADKYRCLFCTSDYRELLSRGDIDAVLVATRHHLHAQIAADALRAGKDVFVEKPLAMTEEQLRLVGETLGQHPERLLMVGFNRRFSPLVKELRDAMSDAPLMLHYRVNAGFIPGTNWVQDPEVGGGRIVGEICHFVDLMQFLTQSEPLEVFARAVPGTEERRGDPDTLSIQLQFGDGSVGSIAYVANGDASFPKERIEVFGGGVVGVIDNWRRLEVQKHGRRHGRRLWLSAAKGHAEEMAAFAEAVRSREWPIVWKSLELTTRVTFAIQQSLHEGHPVALGPSARQGREREQ